MVHVTPTATAQMLWEAKDKLSSITAETMVRAVATAQNKLSRPAVALGRATPETSVPQTAAAIRTQAIALRAVVTSRNTNMVAATRIAVVQTR